MADSSKKALHVSLAGLILSIVFFLTTLLLGAFLSSPTLYILSWQILGTLLIWGVLMIQFFHRCRAEQEKLDMDQLSRAREKQTIFEGAESRLDLFAVAQKRLVLLEKWFLPIAGLVIAIFQIILGILLLRFVSGPTQEDYTLQSPLVGSAILALVSFFSFLISRYATGLSGSMIWRPLRAGGSSLLASSILGFGLVISLAFAQYKYMFGLMILNWVIPILMILLGGETVVTTIFDIYRPRMAGQYSRASFDSRLLGLINEPGGILHTVASTLDYQFGFKVSQTWFYKLLEKAILPLLLFMIVTIYLFSTVVIVGPGEGAIIEHLGSADLKQGGRQVGPGWSWKWPWPFEQAYVYPMDRILQINVGFVPTPEDLRKPMLWGEKHYKEEYKLLVAVETGGRQGQEGAAPISYIIANIPVHYKIRDLYKYLYEHQDTPAMLEALCYRELARFAASAKIEPDEETTAPGQQKSLLGAGQQEASRTLHQRIQEAADREELGVEVVFVGMVGVHPPPEVATDYQDVVAAVQRQQATILTAQAQRNRILTELAGSLDQVDHLYSLVRQLSQARRDMNQAKIDEITDLLQKAVYDAQGKVYASLRSSEAYAFERVSRSRGEGLRFAGQIKANQEGGILFQHLQRLLVMEEALPSIRKYVVVSDKEDQEIFIFDLQEKLATGILEMDVDSALKK